jgi:hypothetical protein
MHDPFARGVPSFGAWVDPVRSGGIVLANSPQEDPRERYTMGQGRFSEAMGSHSTAMRRSSDSVFTTDWYKIPTPSGNGSMSLREVGAGTLHGGLDSRSEQRLIQQERFTGACVLQAIPYFFAGKEHVEQFGKPYQGVESGVRKVPGSSEVLPGGVNQGHNGNDKYLRLR